MIKQVFDKRQALYVYDIQELYEMYEEGNVQLRSTNKAQVRLIRSYIIENLESNNVYLPPLVGAVIDGSLTDSNPKQLTIIDGSHRLQAILSLPSYLTKLLLDGDIRKEKQGLVLKYAYPKIKVAVQVFEGLKANEIDQLFLDLNTRGKKVSLSKRIEYDSRDEINMITNRLLKNNRLLQVAGIEVEKVAIVRPKNKKFLSLAQLRNVVGIFLTGKDVESKISVKMGANVNFQEGYELTELWLEELFKLYSPKKIGDYDISMLASYPIVLAVVHYALANTEKLSLEQKKEVITRRMQRIAHVDWSRNQPFWQQFKGTHQGKNHYYYLSKDKKSIQSLVNWLQAEGGEVNVKG